MSEQDGRKNWIERFGAGFPLEPGWEIIHEFIDSRTGLFAVITRHAKRRLIKADLFAKFDAEAWPTPRWESVGCVEAFFGPDDMEVAIQHLLSATQHYDPRP